MTNLRRVLTLTLLTGATVACGSNAPTATPPATTTPTVTTLAVTTTSTLKRTIVLPSTTTVEVSRDSRVAIQRCMDTMGPRFYAAVAVESIGRTSSPALREAQAACDEAALQLKADGIVVLDYHQPSSDLLAAVATLNLALSFAAVRVAGETFDTGETTLMLAVDQFVKQADKAIADL